MISRLLFTSAVLFGLLVTPLSAQNRLHLIMAGDETHSKLGPQALRNQEMLEFVFQDLVASRQLQILWLNAFVNRDRGEKCSPESLKKAFRALSEGYTEKDDNGDPLWQIHPLQEGDAVLLYIYSEGSYDIPQSEQTLIYSGGKITRTDLEIQLVSTFQTARLIVLLTETFPSQTPMGEVNFEQNVALNEPIKRITAPGLSALFFQAEGFANINSCDWAQIPLPNYQFKTAAPDERNTSRAAPFTTQFCLTLQAEQDNQRLNWKSFFAKLNQGTSNLFDDSFPNGRQIVSLSGEKLLQQKQTPIFLGDLPLVPGEFSQPKPRLGVSVSELPGPGVIVVRVDENAPATKCWNAEGETYRIESDDVILKVNTTTIENLEDFLDAIGRSPREAILRIRSARGEVHEVTCRLRE